MRERIILFADEGKVITDGTNFGKTAILAEGVSSDTFYEVTDEQYQKIVAEQDTEPVEV